VYEWWVFLHLVGVFAFLLAHGVSVTVLFRLRRERDPRKVTDLLALSASSSRVFYVSLGWLLVAGIVAGTLRHWWSQGWIWASLIVLVVTSVAMLAMASPYYRKVGFVARAMASGSTAVTKEQFDEILRSGRSVSVAAIGIVGLVLILYLMVLKPTLGFGGVSVPPPPVARGSAGACAPNGTSLQIAAKDVAFDRACLAAPAQEAFTIEFANQDSVPHNVSIYTDSSATTALFTGALQSSPGTITYQVPPLSAGSYFFRCDVHPSQMTGRFVVR
jgi:plastocyanin